MPLSKFASSWQGTGYRTSPAGSPIGITDTRFAGTREGRWNREGEAVFYISGDVSIALTEFARWLKVDAGGVPPQARDIYQFNLELDSVVDLRRADVQAALGISKPTAFTTYANCQAYASIARISSVEAILVPPLGALDRADAWNLVVFLDRFSGQASFVTKSVHVNTVTVAPPSPPDE